MIPISPIRRFKLTLGDGMLSNSSDAEGRILLLLHVSAILAEAQFNRPRKITQKWSILNFSTLKWQLSIILTWNWHNTVITTNEVQGKCTTILTGWFPTFHLLASDNFYQCLYHLHSMIHYNRFPLLNAAQSYHR